MRLTSQISEHVLRTSHMFGNLEGVSVFEVEYLVSGHNDWFKSIEEDRQSVVRSSIRMVKALSGNQLTWLEVTEKFIAFVDAYEAANLVMIAGALALRNRFATMNGGKAQIENRHNASSRFVDGKGEMTIDDAATFLKSEV